MTAQLSNRHDTQHNNLTHRVEDKAFRSTARMAAYTTIAATVTMIIGAILWGTSGTDLWEALDSGNVAGYLTAVAGVKPQLVANLSVWIFGVLLIGVAGSSLTSLCRQRPFAARVALVCFQTAVPLVIVSYIAMMAVVVQIGGDSSATAVALGEVVGWIGVRADDLATALILGGGPLFISLAGRDDWMPTWLVRWGYLAGVVGLFSLLVLYIPSPSALGFAILPVGMGWMLAAGIFLLRRTGQSVF